MKTFFKYPFFFISFLLLPCIFLCFGCDLLTIKTEGKKKTNLLIWVDATKREIEFYNSRVSCYLENNKKLAVTVEGIPFSDMKPRLLGQGNTDKLPDIVYMSSDWIGELAVEKVIIPLPHSLFDTSLATTSVTFENKKYALPFAYDVVSLLVNRDLVPKNPSTLEQLFVSDRELNGKILQGITPTGKSQWPLVYDNKNFYYHGPFYFAFGGSFSHKSGIFGMDEKAATESLIYALKLEQVKSVIPVSANQTAMMSLFCQKQCKSIISGPWDYIKAKSGGVNVAVVPLPLLRNGGRLRSFVSTHGFALTNSRANSIDSSKEALSLIAFLASKKNQEIASATIGIVPVSSAPDLKIEPWVEVFRQEVYKGVIMPNVPSMAIFWSKMNWLLTNSFLRIKNDAIREQETKISVKKLIETIRKESSIKAMNATKKGMP